MSEDLTELQQSLAREEGMQNLIDQLLCEKADHDIGSHILHDVYDDTSEAIATVKTTSAGISIEVAGYGSANGANEVALIELANGVPQVVIWANRDQEDPTHIIKLDKAELPKDNNGWIGTAGDELTELLKVRGLENG